MYQYFLNVQGYATWYGSLPQQVKQFLQKRSSVIGKKLLALTSELLLGFKVEINKAIPTFHKAILFHLPLELDRQPFIDLHAEAFFIAVQG